ncbi:aminomethyltransferase [Stackebrandtia albiflava]|uniref:Aminomethyltransferase n=1 Tax=Stackebrandtia albiflava TaxID=406432 RepID=A0A562VBC2_9ACTN|nr:glycine cleavage system aminomethyltransferase GcvT [Stackebrandtia albiflava]TWJ15158.1 aminomethyltransferase [Stackebrandtia albiflava]
MTETSQPIQSPLRDRHDALGAKFAEFGGWLMPLEYGGGGVVAEHTAVREAVGLFDVSHLGKIDVSGPGAADFVNDRLSNDLRRIAPGKAQYTLCCDDSGGVVDDLIAYLYGPDRVFLVPNAANNAEVAARLAAEAPADVAVTDEHRDHAVLALQGPHSARVLADLGVPADHEYMSFVTAECAGTSIVACRTGYTGEHGYELLVPADAAGAVWDALMTAGAPHGIRPAGLGARDTLRTEMGYPLHGHELSMEITPVQARAGWAVGWRKPHFWGRDALTEEKATGPRRRLWGLEATGRGIPRADMTVRSGDTVVGTTTSGTFSPTRKIGIALALIDTAAGVDEGTELSVDVRGRALPVKVVKPPFVTPSVK